MDTRLDRKWLASSGLRLAVSYVLTIGATRVLMLALPTPASRWVGLSVFWGVMLAILAVDDPGLVRGLVAGPARRAFLGLAVGLGFAALTSVGLGLGAIRGAGVLTIPAVLCALFEAIYFFFWWRRRLERAMPALPALLWSAVAYALYHLGYYGFGQAGLDALRLTVGTYVVAGCVMGILASYFETLWAVWPFFMGVAALQDFTRLKVTGGGDPLTAALAAGITLVVLAGLAVWRLVAVHAGGETEEAAPLSPGGAAPRGGDVRSAFSGRRRAFGLAGAWLAGATVIGLMQRLIINDPVVLDPRVTANLSSFILHRDFLQETLLRMGFVIYLVVPLLSIYLWHDSRERGGNGSEPGLWAEPLIASLGASASVVLASVAGAVGLLVTGTPVTFTHVGMAGVLAVASGLYTWLNASLVMAVSRATPAKNVRWFALFLGYIFIFNWWMVYPLFAQYTVAGPLPADPGAAGQWMSLVWTRATPLYAIVPHYHYYMSLVVSYVRHILDRQLVGMHLAMLGSYAAAAWLLAVRLGRKVAGTVQGGK